MTLLALNQVTKIYQLGDTQHVALNNFTLSVQSGEMLAIVGSSGSGKSTLMNIIGLLDKADSGEYQLNQRSVAYLTENELAELRNKYIGFVFQQFHLLARLTAAQNVGLPLTYRTCTPATIQRRVRDALARVGMSAYTKHCPTQLSGGQQQRIAIARALIGEPQIILADEPTGALDSVTGKTIMDLFSDLHQEGRTVILVTHDEQVAAQCSRRIALADGKMIADSQR